MSGNVTVKSISPLCVIKQLCPQTTNSKSWELACDRFEKEAKTLGQLGKHSQIPMLLDYFGANGEFYLVQEYVRGYTLAQFVRRTGPKGEAAVKQFLRELLLVLQYVLDALLPRRQEILKTFQSKYPYF